MNLYKNWAKLSLPLAVLVLSCLFGFKGALSASLFWIWFQFPVYLIHEFEEHVWPGKFKEFINKEVFHSLKKDAPLNQAAVFWMNILVIWILFPFVAVSAQFIEPKIGAFLPYFSLFNATTHIGAFLVKKKYNPGLLASLVLNYPLGIYALVVLAKHGDLTWAVSGLALLACLLIHLAMIFAIVRRSRSFTGN